MFKLFKPFLWVWLLLACLSCQVPVSSGGSSGGGNDGASEGGVSGMTNVFVQFTNQTGHKIELYSDPQRDPSTLVHTLAAGASGTLPVDSAGEHVFYLTYYVDVGMDVPWWDITSSVAIVNARQDRTVQKILYAPDNMETHSAYVVVQNQSQQAVQFMRGASTPLSPSGGTAEFPGGLIGNYGDAAIYEIRTPGVANLQLSQFYLEDALSGTEYPLPAAFTGFAKSMIYTLSFDGTELHLVSVIPFNKDTGGKIWSRKSSAAAGNYFVTQVLRSRRDGADGSIVLGQKQASKNAATGTGYVMFLDEYGKTTKAADITVAIGDKPATNYQFLDVLEDSGGRIVLLAKISVDSGKTYGTYLICRDGDFTANLWTCALDKSVLFRPDTRGKLVEVGANTYALCGGVYTDASAGKNSPMAYYLATVEWDGARPAPTKSEYIGGSPAAAGREQMFTSMIYDKTSGSFFCAGYDNFDGSYSAADPHRGVVIKISGDLAAAEEVYSREKTLLFGIDGDGAGKWYACGEYADAGNALHGCIVTSGMGTAEVPRHFSGGAAHSWFNQICVEERRIVLSGQSGKATDGSDATPWVMAADFAGKKLWSNTYGGGYNAVFTCMQNGIGSFLMALYNTEDFTSKIISTDLLGRDTGEALGVIP